MIFLNAIPDVIRRIESYDTTTVRASVGNCLIGKYISENSDAKVILTKNEVIAAEKNYPNSALYIVSGIFLDRSKKPVKASLGKLSLKKYPWEIKKDINEKN